MQDKLTPRQSRAWGLCALSVPAAMVLAGRGWLWVLAGSAAASGIMLFLQTLQRRSGQSLPERMARAFGRRGGQIVGAAVCLWLLLAASGAVRGEGATREYIDPSYPAVADMPLLGALLSCGVPDAGLFRSHDCTSLETPWAPGGPARIARWAELGVSALDGETSALFVLASILGMHAASLAYLAENYATGAAAPMDAQARERLFTAAAEALRCC